MFTKKYGDIRVGDRFNRLTVKGFSQKKYYLDCYCDCGESKTIHWCNIKKGATVSCGCYNKEKAKDQFKTHGLRHHRLYRVWANMKDRCYCENNKNYFRYGGRGIVICDAWKNNFKVFYDWAMSNGYEERLTIDRIDTNSDYRPENCRFVSMKIQARNRRGYSGKLLSKGVSKGSKKYRATITKDRKRIHLGMFDTEQEASDSYKKASIELFGFYNP